MTNRTQNLRSFTSEDLLALQRVADRTPFHLSPDGKWLAVTIQTQERERTRSPENYWGNDGIPNTLVATCVVIVETTTGATLTPFLASNTSWSPQWSPDGRYLAAYVKDAGMACLGIWDSLTKDIQLWRHVLVRPTFGDQVPQWMPDSNSVVVKICDVQTTFHLSADFKPKQSAPNVEVFSFDPVTSEGSKFNSSQAGMLVGDLAIVNVRNGIARRLAKNYCFCNYRVAPDGHAVAVLKIKDSSSSNGESYFDHDLVIVPFDETPARTVATGVIQADGLSFSWSPDSQSLAYSSGDRIYVVPASGELEPFQLSEETDRIVAQPYYAPRWSPDGKYIFSLTSDGIWQSTTDGKRQQKLKLNCDREIRGVMQRPLGNSWSLIDRNTLQLLIRDPKTKNEGLARLDLHSGETKILLEFPKSFVGEMACEVAPNGSWFFVTQTADSPGEICYAHPDGKIQKLCDLNPQLIDVAFGTSQLVAWRSLEGKLLQGALLLPPDYTPGKPLPLIVQVHGGFNDSELLHRFGFGGRHVDNAQLLASRGYAVLCPDLPMGDRDAMHQLPGLLLPALDRLIDQGIVDANRIGVMGHSYGGYNVLSLLTQTARFGAAVSMSGVVNLTSFYGTISSKGDSVSIDWAESGQGRLGGTLWEKRDAFIENSPLFYLDRVETPVLLISGTTEPGEAAQAGEAFSALQRLDKRVELCIYNGENHSPVYWTKESVGDLCDRVLKWFDSYL